MQDGLVYVDGQVQPEPWLPAAYRDSANMPPTSCRPATSGSWAITARSVRTAASSVPYPSGPSRARSGWSGAPGRLPAAAGGVTRPGVRRRRPRRRGRPAPHQSHGPLAADGTLSGRPPTPARPGRRRADRAAPADPWRASRPARQPTAAPAAGPLRRREQPDCCSPSLRVVRSHGARVAGRALMAQALGGRAYGPQCPPRMARPASAASGARTTARSHWLSCATSLLLVTASRTAAGAASKRAVKASSSKTCA